MIINTINDGKGLINK